MIQIRKKRYPAGTPTHGCWIPASPFPSPKYFDPKTRRVSRTLRVDERRPPSPGGGGFPTHPASRHGKSSPMSSTESLAHQGQAWANGSVIKPGDVQYMSGRHGRSRTAEFKRFGQKFPCTCTKSGCFPDKTGLRPGL